MQSIKHILDNQESSVAEYLKRQLRDADTFRLVSAYFTIYGYELLADELNQLDDVRFLFGDPTSVDELDPGDKSPKSFEMTEQGLLPNHALGQKWIALQCAKWVERESVAIRSISKSNFLHGKMYLTDSSNSIAAGVVGSSNFTKNGLGGSSNPNLEINVAIDEVPVLTELRDWFDAVWKNKTLTQDVKQQVLDALNRIGENHSPELIYYKTLYELFRKEIEARREGEDDIRSGNLTDSAIWNALYDFQKDGARSVISRLQQHNGCMLADSVGLGKTYTALAVIRYYEMNNRRVLVLCPKKLRENWSLYQASNGHVDNPFIEDRFGYSLLSHTDLSRVQGRSGDIDLANFNWGSYHLVVIDESHNFRNMDGSRYQHLLNEIIKQGVETKVLMLSATPVNTSLTDLRNQIYLMTEGREADFQESLGVSNIRSLLGTAEREFRRWENEVSKTGVRNKDALLDRLGPAFFRLLGGISISRSRRQIERFYSEEMERIGQFPTHAKPANHYPPTDVKGALSYKEMSDQIDKFELSIYRPSDYLIDEGRLRELEEERAARNFNQRDRERFLIGMIRTNFLKRLESSARSLTLTLERTIGKIDAVLEQISLREVSSQFVGDQVEAAPDEDDDDEDFLVSRGRHPYRLREIDLPRWSKDLQRDKKTLRAALKKVTVITPDRDGKLRELRRVICERAENPTINQDGRAIRKLLVFTTFRDTAEYLYENLADLATELRLNMAMVAGDVTHTEFGANNFNSILTNFAPVARNRGAAQGPGEIDLLIATDCISEGQNLQDCDTVLNYDIHWNPVRLIQRFGRIDRIGSRNDVVQMMNYWPTDDMEVYLRLRHRVQSRMALADMAAGGGDDPFTEEQAGQELGFRDKQLLKLREEVLDLDDLSDSPVMSDFTLDHFLIQLYRFLERNRERLEKVPIGAYAVTEAGADSAAEPLRPGALFCLRQRNTSGNLKRQASSPVHPYYLVYIQDDGRIRHGCGNAKQVLNAFESRASGEIAPISRLCDRFDRETDTGKDMAHYDELLRNVVSHIRQSHNRVQRKSIGIHGARDFELSKKSETPQDEVDFELVTWLITMPQST